MKQYTDLFIDLDDTLYDTRGNAIIALSELFDILHLERYFSNPDSFYEAYWNTNMKLWALYAHGDITRDYLIVERFRRPLALGKGLDPTREYCLEVSDRFLELCANKSGVIEGAHHLLRHLRSKGYRMHICSNGFHEVQYKKMKAAGLYDFFDTIILSEDAGANKPSQQFFDFALQKTGANPSCTLMIGDNYNTDIIGAKNAGIDTMLFNRWDPTFKPESHTDYIVNSLKEITTIL